MNVSDIHNCFGCGVCAVVCSKNIIDIRLNEDGFLEPFIKDVTRCTDCGLCIEVCAFSHDSYALVDRTNNAYGAWSKEFAVQRKCSSGGVGFEVGRYLLSQNYKVVGCRYNVEKGRAEHYIATDLLGLIPSIGSKYIQSYTVDAFKAINRKEKYLVTGTPCQIESFRRYIQKFRCEDNFVLMDFFCHGVPSMLMWNKYVKLIEQKTGKVTYVSWRSKQTGWHDSWVMGINGELHGEIGHRCDSYDSLIKEDKTIINSRLSQGDIFYKLFLGTFCGNPACIKDCRFKYDKSSADIRLGDAWGTLYDKNENGVSAVIAFTERGNNILNACNINLIRHSFNDIAEGQMKKNAVPAKLSFIARKMLKSPNVYSEKIWKILIKTESFLHIPHLIKKKLIKLISESK